MILVVTHVNNDALYAEMVASFRAAGFSDFEAVRRGDPFLTIRQLGQRDAVTVLCHQDVRLDQGHGLTQLQRVVADLDHRDPSWVVAGNAGGRRMRVLLHVAGPEGAVWRDDLPLQVDALDENLLILNGKNRPRCSEELSGFHLYGCDVCLHAGGGYMVDFRLTHLSGGDQAALQDALPGFRAMWSRRFLARYVRTPSVLIGLSRFRPVEIALNSRWLQSRLEVVASRTHQLGLRRSSGRSG